MFLKKRPRRGKGKIVVLRKVKRKSIALNLPYPGDYHFLLKLMLLESYFYDV